MKWFFETIHELSTFLAGLAIVIGMIVYNCWYTLILSYIIYHLAKKYW